jgi:hypothetical protein
LATCEDSCEKKKEVEREKEQSSLLQQSPLNFRRDFGWEEGRNRFEEKEDNREDIRLEKREKEYGVEK